MNTRTYTAFLCAAATALAVCSCSIKEDRSACPCELNLDYSLIRSDSRIQSAENRDSLLVTVQGLYNAIVRISDYPLYHSINVPRTRTHLSCHLGMSEERLQNGRSRIVIPLGEDSDRLFSYHRTLELTPQSEEEYVTPELCNEFTRVIIEFEDPESCVSNAENILRVTGSSCGLDLLTGLALSGEFRYDMDFAGERSWCFNMPRQKDKDIRIDVLNRSSEDKVFTIDLASELDNAGYGWSAESLAPLVIVKISARNVPVEVKIIDWDEAIYFNYTL